MPPNSYYRPWGLASWLLPRIRVSDWTFIGCIGTEERSTACWRSIHRQIQMVRTSMLQIRDEPSHFSGRAQSLLDARRNEFFQDGGRASDIAEHQLMESHSLIIDAVSNLLVSGPTDVLVDITSMPKRFFFPIVRRLIESPSLARSIVVTYTVPRAYTSEHLSERHNDWAHLPLFTGPYPSAKTDMLIVSVGFEALGLLEQIEQAYKGVQVKLMVPFPAPFTAFNRSLELAWRIQRFRRTDSFTTFRADAKDASDAFSRLLALTRGPRAAVLAPFGPKPISLAMAIFATLTNSEVFYCQPTVYHPEYSLGVSTVAAGPEIYAYCIRLAGHDFFSLSN